jgi:hypothetical protein
MRFFILALILNLIFAGGLSAQSKNTLADGNPPLTQTMVNRLTNLMRWSLDSEFTDEERSDLRSLVVEYWKTGDEKGKKSVLDSLAFEEKLTGASQGQKQNLQPQVQRQLLELLEKESNDPLSKILLGVYKRNHNNDSAANVENSGGGTLTDLIGRWQVSHMNSMTTQNVYTGALGDANGMIAEYDIKADGRVIFSFYLSQNNYGCTTKIKTSKTGRAVVNGSRVTFAYDSGTTTSSDSCNAKNNYTKNLGKTNETFDYAIKRENGKTQFCFADAKLKDCAIKLN